MQRGAGARGWRARVLHPYVLGAATSACITCRPHRCVMPRRRVYMRVSAVADAPRTRWRAGMTLRAESPAAAAASHRAAPIAARRHARARASTRRRARQAKKRAPRRTRSPLSAALCTVAVRASRRAAARPARRAVARHRVRHARGVRFLLRWRAALGAAECTCDPGTSCRRRTATPIAERVAVPCGDIEWASAPCAAGG
jgi:hypothetical protein